LPGGKYENTLHGSGAWKVTSRGLEINSVIFRVEMRDDGWNNFRRDV
jgi:hypothetical protein